MFITKSKIRKLLKAKFLR